MLKLPAALALFCAIAFPAFAESLQERMAPCLACHGEKGQSENPEVPSLGGQPAYYMLIQLYLFREKQRKIDVMVEMAKGLTDDDLRKFSDSLAVLPPPKPEDGPADAARMEHGKALAQQYHCNVCHQGDLSGVNNVPRLAAQREDYLLKALREYKSNARVGYEPTMQEVMGPVKEGDIPDLAYAIARMK